MPAGRFSARSQGRTVPVQALIVEDDENLAAAIAHILARDGYGTDVVHDGQTAMEYARARAYDVIIFDVMLPKMSGLRAVESLRRQGVETPVLMLTAKDTVPDKISGLDAGADVYMTKPFAAGELRARLRALLRRVPEQEAPVLRFGDLALDEASFELSCGGESFQLTNKEFLLAQMLMAQGGSVVTKQQLAAHIWEGDVSDNGIEAYISMLRKKLRYLKSAVSVKLVRTVGYRLVDEKGAGDGPDA